MFALSQPSGYALVALGYLATGSGKPVLVRTIAEERGLPAPYLSKLIHRLAKAGIVKTQRGLHGGVTLAVDPAECSIMRICRILGDPILEQRCLLGVARCADVRACPAHGFASVAREQATAFLERTTIAEIGGFELSQTETLLNDIARDDVS
ncbi:MAG: Rrf2 family transcriptional regulator [Planctomycetota bacterium]